MPGEESEIADYITKVIDTANWMLNLKLFSMLNDLWGPYTIDWFANAENTQTPLWCL